MRVLGYVMLHYGSDYLEYALESLCTVCEKVIILYSLVPTHNGKLEIANYDSMETLKAIADRFPQVEWINVYGARNEGEHRSRIWERSGGFDVLVNSDYDEVWEPEDLKRAVEEVYHSPYRAHGIDGFKHFWRSFDNYFDDGFRPVRLWHLREKNTQKQPEIKATVYHFGYAIKKRKMEYKMSIHGHRAEWRQDWYEKWLNWTPEERTGHFHPTSFQIWNELKHFDKEKLPEFMRKHPYFNKEII